MASPASPAETQALIAEKLGAEVDRGTQIVERLVGETGEPERVIEAMRGVAEKAAPEIAAALAEVLSFTATVEVRLVEIARLAFAKPTAEGHTAAFAASTSSPDMIVIAADPGALGLIVNAFFGADPAMAAPPIERALSATELHVASVLLEETAKAVGRSSNGAFEAKLPLPTVLAGADLRKFAVRDGPAARAVFTLTSPAGTGTVTLTLPQRLLLKPRIDAAPGASPEWRARFGEEVMRSAVTLQATMPLARMTLGELACLQAGQLIEMDADAWMQAKLSARQKTLFVCEFGKLGQNYTVRVRHPFDAGQDLIDGLMPG